MHVLTRILAATIVVFISLPLQSQEVLDVVAPGPAMIIPSVKIGRPVFTISCWVKAKSVRGKERVIIAKGERGARSHFQLKLARSSGELQFFSPGLSANINSRVTIDDNQWHHIGVTYAQHVVKIYVDGMLVQAVMVKDRFNDDSTVLAIGSMTGGAAPFGGDIARVKIFSSVLSDSRVKDLYLNKLASWDLGEGMGITTLSDYGNTSYGKLEGPINTYDNFGDAHTGRLWGATWEKDTRFGHVLGFGAPGSGVHVKKTDTLDLKNGFTITCWVRAGAENGKGRVILAKGTTSNAPDFFQLLLEPNTGMLQFIAPAIAIDEKSGVLLNDNAWHHIAVSYGDGVMKFYKDGLLIRTVHAKGNLQTGGQLTIGCSLAGDQSFGGQLAHLNIFGSALSGTAIEDQYYEIETAGWDLAEGSGMNVRDKNAGKNNGKIIEAAWVPGKGSSFSRVLSFSKPGAHVSIDAADINLAKRFTIAAWVQAPRQRAQSRVILAKDNKGSDGDFFLRLDARTGHLSFYAAGLSGDMNSGFTIDDTVWHHVMITYGNGIMKFYRDCQLIKTSKVSGAVANANAPLAIGSMVGGSMSFGGNMAHVKIYNAVKTPGEVTSVVPPAGPKLILKKGIVFDRIQNQGFPVKPEWQISPNDIAVAKAAGFDHIKILLTADQFIEGAGVHKLNMKFVDTVVDRALASGLPCVVDLHPEPAFKYRYLGSDTGFTQVLGFYKEFAQYLAARWSPGQVAFQLMTEPFGPNGKEYKDWNILQDQMVAAVRQHMPHHTLILSGNRAGNIYAMTALVPLDDPNIYYSFTTYEPYRFGFSTSFGGWRGASAYWKDISYMPWPTSPEIVQARMDQMLAKVKPADREKAREDLLIYGNSYFNRQWMFRRAKNVSEWNDAYGGRIHVIVAEFGAIDHIQGRKNGASEGVYPEERVQFVRDLRESFEAFGIGWEYWSFNEFFTILNPSVRKPYGVSSVALLDTAMLSALGL